MFYHKINPVLLKIGSLEIRYYGLIFVIGFIIAYFMLNYLVRKKEIKLSKDDISDLLVYVIVGVIIGCRLFYVLFYNLKFYLQNPFDIIAIWHGGLSFHGGLIGVIVAGILFCKKKKISFYELADITVIPLAIGLFLGRIGNLINGELYGRVTNSFLCVDYSQNPHLLNVPQGCRHISQIYESLKNLFIFIVLWNVKDKKLPKGFLFLIFITLYAFLRFFIEFIRQPDEQLGFIFFGLTMGQILNIGMLVFAVFVYFDIRKKSS